MDNFFNERFEQVNAGIPIIFNNGIFLDSTLALEFGKNLSHKYCSNKPYPHIVIDNFLPTDMAYQIHANFPDTKLTNASEFEFNYTGIQEYKRQINPINTNYFCRNIFGFFNSAPFLQFLEGLTTIDGIISDSYFVGGGFHEIISGGKLGIHADFRINEKLHLFRRINVLIYLNPIWNDEWGGNLEIWDNKIKIKEHSISPIFNRCVIFNTDSDSYHGHPDPLNCPANITRKSIALYYYTASKSIYEEMASNSTMYVPRPSEKILTRKNAFILRFQNHLKDFLPPFIFRSLRKFKKSIR